MSYPTLDIECKITSHSETVLSSHYDASLKWLAGWLGHHVFITTWPTDRRMKFRAGQSSSSMSLFLFPPSPFGLGRRRRMEQKFAPGVAVCLSFYLVFRVSIL